MIPALKPTHLAAFLEPTVRFEMPSQNSYALHYSEGRQEKTMDSIKSFEKILLVQDDQEATRLLRQRLQHHGYVVLTATNCEEAIAQAKTEVDLVILDPQLGDMTGLDVCQQLRREGLDLPVVLLTEANEESFAISAFRCGVQDLVPRAPQYLDYLPAAAERVLRQARAKKSLEGLEARRRQSQKMEALGQLAGGVAHEFNNLLQVILGFTEGVHEELKDRPQLRDDLHQVLDAVTKAATITGQLLAFGRCQSMDMEAVNLKVLVEDMMRMMRPLLGLDIRIETLIDPQLEPVWGSEAMLGQVVMNLCLNARDAMVGGGTLTIDCCNITLTHPLDHVHDTLAPGPYVRLKISDTGTGIPLEHLHRLYEPFFTTKPHGTGMGLATAFGIIKEHGGAVEVQSTVGEGTTFVVYLPRTRSVTSARSADLTEAVGGTETVLIADDEAGVRQYLERVLSRAGYHVLTAEDGEEALQVFLRNQDKIELLLLDLMMPKMGGRAAWQAIQAIRPDVKCALVSGYGPDTEQSDSASDARLEILPKPIRRRELLQAVRALLDKPSRSPARKLPGEDDPPGSSRSSE